MATVTPIRSTALPLTYHQGWRDGLAYSERVNAWRWRLQGAFGALVIACAVIALALYLTGGFR